MKSSSGDYWNWILHCHIHYPKTCQEAQAKRRNNTRRGKNLHFANFLLLPSCLQISVRTYFNKIFGGHKSFLWGH